MIDRLKGNIEWELIPYDDCEKRGFFSGIRIGLKYIYFTAPYLGESVFLVFNKNPKEDVDLKAFDANMTVDTLSPREFKFITKTFFSENDEYKINKYIWRVSS